LSFQKNHKVFGENDTTRGAALPKSFRVIGYLEGISFLLLLFIAMPLKYLWDLPSWVRVVGMWHGILFLLYILVGTAFAIKFKWKLRAVILIYVASMIPFGPFLLDRWLYRMGFLR